MMPKMKNRYMSMLLSTLLCFSNSFTAIQAEEETVPEEPEVLEAVEEQQEPEEVSESEIIIDQSLTEEQGTEETDSVLEELPPEPVPDEETETADPETTAEEILIPEVTEEPQAELSADQEDTTWQRSFYYKLENGHLVLNRVNTRSSCYLGTASDVIVPAQAVINGVTYITELGKMAFYSDTYIVNLSFEEGVILPADCTNLFGNCKKLSTLDISSLDMSRVTNMSQMFQSCTALTNINLGDPDTSSVTDMSRMFNACTRLTSLNVDELDTENVVDMSFMFGQCDSLTSLDVSKLNTGNVVNMSHMFSNCSSLTTIDISMLDTGNVTDMSYMFERCSALKQPNINVIDLSSAANMSHLFSQCSALETIDLSGLDAGHVTDMSYMFYYCTALKSLSINGLNTSSVKNMSYMFYNCSQLTSLDISRLDTSHVTDMSNMLNCYSLTSLSINGIDTSHVENMSAMFAGCNSLKTLDISGLDTGNVKRIDRMFFSCNKLSSLDISMLNTSSVTNMSSIFESCSSLTSLTINGINTSSVTDMSRMFNGCSSLVSLDISKLDTGNVTNMSYMFGSCSALKTLDVSKLNTKSVTNMYYMFGSCSSLTSLDISMLDTRNVTNMQYMFTGCSALTSLEMTGINTSSAANMSYMFHDCSSLTALDLSALNTSNVTDISYMFSYCTKLQTIDIKKLNTGNVRNMSSMFSHCNALTEIDVSMLDTRNVTNMSYLFSDCLALLTVVINGIDTSNVTNMAGMFRGCQALETADISELNTSSVINMSGMFSDCKALKTVDISGLNTSNVTDMSSMFNECRALTTLDISKFDTGKVTNMRDMFRVCSSLASLNINGINTSGVTDISYMFFSCRSLPKLDLCKLDMTGVQKTDSVFSSISLDTDDGCSLYLPASFPVIKGAQFSGSKLKNIYYGGTEDEWNARVGNNDISNISDVSIHFNYVPGSEEPEGQQVDWEYSELTSTMIIQGEGNMKSYTDEDVPWKDIRDNLLSAVIGNELESIGSCALQNTPHLQRVYIPASVTEIKANAFNNTPELQDIYFAGTQEQWEAVVIGQGNASLSTAAVHYQCPYDFAAVWEYDPETSTLKISGNGPMTDLQQTSAPWYIFKDLITAIVVKEGITAIGAYAFKDITNLNRMYIPLSAAIFNEYALDNDQLLLDIYYTGTEEQWGNVVTKTGNDVLFSDTLTVHYNSPYEETIVQIKRSDAWYDAVKVKQTYYFGSDEKAELRVIPAAKYDNVSFIALKRGTETLHAWFPEDGTITFVPGKELAAGDVLKIVLCTMETETIEEYELAIEIVENRFTITYFYNEYLSDQTIYKTEEYRLGSEIRKPEDPVREGYAFEGWYANQECTGIGFFDPRHGLNRVNTDTALYAKWSKIGFDIMHDAWSFDNSGKYFYGDNYNKLSEAEKKKYHYEIADSYFEQLLTLIDNFVEKCQMRSKRKTKWPGSCFGMSAVAMLAKMKYLSIKSFDQNAEDVRLANIYVNPVIDKDVGDIESLINYYTLLQYVKPLATAVEAHSNNESDNLKNIVEKMEKTGQPVLLNIDIIDDEDGKVGHTVIGYDFEKKSDNEYSFSVYDCSKSSTKVYEVTINKDSSGTYTAEYEDWVSVAGWENSILFLDNAMTAEELASFGLLVRPGEIVRKSVNGTVAAQTGNMISLETGYSSFTITNGSGTATISNSTVLSDGIGGVVSHGQNNYQYGSDRFTFDLPILSEGDSYTIIPTDHEADNYMTIISFGNGEDGFFVLVDADREGTIIVDRYGKVSTSYDTETQQEIWVCSEQMKTPWYLIEIEGTSTGFTAEAVNGTVQSASAADVQVAVESDLNRYEISNVPIDTDGIQVVEGNNLTCEILSDDEIIGRGTFGYSVVFDSSHGTNVETLTNVPAGSKIQKPEDPTRDGYVFEGWYKEKTFDTEWNFDTDEVTDNLVLYAGWSADEDYLVTVTFKMPEAEDAVVYLPRNMILDAEKYPSTQDGLGLKWYTESDLTNEWNKAEPFTEDTILYAGGPDAEIADYGEVLAEDIPADGIIPEGIWTAGIKDKQYIGSAIKQNFRVYDGTRLLKEKTDYTVTYKNNTNACTYEGDRSSFEPAKGDKTPYILITGKGNYSGKTYVPFSIEKIDINDADKVYFEESITLKANGKVQRPVPVITFNGKTVSSKEYTLTYLETEDPDSEEKVLDKKTGPKLEGTYTVRITGKGNNFTGTKDVTLTISDTTEKEKAVALSKAITITAGSVEYDGNAKKDNVSIKPKPAYEEIITEDDYTVAYTKNVNAGTATVTATGKGIYTGTVKKTFKITPRLYADHKDEFRFEVNDAVYSKGGALPEVHVYWNEIELIVGTDYTLKYTNNKQSVADGKVKITFKGNFKGSAEEQPFKITKKDIADVNITAKDLVYKKGKYKSTPVLTDSDGKKLKAGVDYEKTYEYTGNIIDGDAQPETEITVTVTGKGNYTGTVSTTYRILETGKDISKAVFKITDQEYTGSEILITDMSQFTGTDDARNAYITVNKQKEYLVLGEDFEVVPGSYVKNISKGTAKVTFRGINEYGGTKTVSFKIGQRSIQEYWKGIFGFFGSMF